MELRFWFGVQLASRASIYALTNNHEKWDLNVCDRITVTDGLWLRRDIRERSSIITTTSKELGG